MTIPYLSGDQQMTIVTMTNDDEEENSLEPELEKLLDGGNSFLSPARANKQRIGL